MNLVGQLSAWRARRRQERLERWEQTRAKGKVRFVIRATLIWGGTMIVGISLANYFLHRGFSQILFTVIYFLVAGPIVALVSWWHNEGEYTAAKIDARMKAMPKE